jgi:hypothetical protein
MAVQPVPRDWNNSGVRFVLVPLRSGSGSLCSMCNIGLPINQDLLTQRLPMDAGTAGLPTAYPFFCVYASGQVS